MRNMGSANQLASLPRRIVPVCEAAATRLDSSHVTVEAMASDYDLVKFVMLHKEKAYDTVLDSGSPLNLMSWDCAKTMGLTDGLDHSDVSFRSANNQLSSVKGKLVAVPISVKDCNFMVSFVVVDSTPHPLLVGTAFMLKAKAVVFFRRLNPTMFVEDGDRSSMVPITFHRDQASIGELKSRRDCWPQDADQQAGERALAPVVASLRPCFSSVLGSRPADVLLTQPDSGVPSASENLSVEDEIEAWHIADTIESKAQPEARLPAVLSLRQVPEAEMQDKSDWQIRVPIFSELAAEYGPYTRDACSDPNGANAMVSSFWSSEESCIDADWSGSNTWCNPPFHAVEPILKRFMDCKARHPHNTSATFVVPMWTTASWWPLIANNFRMVRYYPPWSKLFTASPIKGSDSRRLAGPTPWPVMIAVCEAGPLTTVPGAHLREGDIHPDKVNDIVIGLRARSDPTVVDSVELVKFGPKVTQEQREEAKALLRSYGRDLWAMDTKDLANPINLVQHHIHTRDEAPAINKGPPRSVAENEFLGQWADEMVEACIIHHSNSSWCSPGGRLEEARAGGRRSAGRQSLLQLRKGQ